MLAQKMKRQPFENLSTYSYNFLFQTSWTDALLIWFQERESSVSPPPYNEAVNCEENIDRIGVSNDGFFLVPNEVSKVWHEDL